MALPSTGGGSGIPSCSGSACCGRRLEGGGREGGGEAGLELERHVGGGGTKRGRGAGGGEGWPPDGLREGEGLPLNELPDVSAKVLISGMVFATNS